MKALLLAIVLTSSASAQVTDVIPEELTDPRGFGRPREWIRAGVDLSAEAMHPLLVIHWMPSPQGEFDVYQISGVAGYHSHERVEACLRAFYSGFAKSGPHVPSMIVCGNNWGAGAPLKPILAELSQQLGFSMFHLGGWAFRTVRLMEEPEARRSAIQRAFESSAPQKKEPNKAPEPTRTAVPR